MKYLLNISVHKKHNNIVGIYLNVSFLKYIVDKIIDVSFLEYILYKGSNNRELYIMYIYLCIYTYSLSLECDNINNRHLEYDDRYKTI